MTHSSSVYWVESKKEGEPDKIVAHTKKGNKLYHEFISRKSATDLLNKEKGINADLKYRVVKRTTTISFEKWQ